MFRFLDGKQATRKQMEVQKRHDILRGRKCLYDCRRDRLRRTCGTPVRRARRSLRSDEAFCHCNSRPLARLLHTSSGPVAHFYVGAGLRPTKSRLYYYTQYVSETCEGAQTMKEC